MSPPTASPPAAPEGLPPALAALGLPEALVSVLRAPSGVLVVAGHEAGPWSDLKLALLEARRQLRPAPSPAAVRAGLVWQRDAQTADAVRQALHAAGQGGFAILTLVAGGLAEALARMTKAEPKQAGTLRAALAEHWVGAAWIQAVPAHVPSGWLLATELACPSDETNEAIRDGDWSFIDIVAARPLRPEDLPVRDEQLLTWVLQGRISRRQARAKAREPAAFSQRLEALGPYGVPEAAGFPDRDPLAELFGTTGGTGLPEPPLDLLEGWNPLAAGPPAPAAAPRRPAPLQLRAYAPAACAPGRLHAIDLWACTAADAPEVDRLASSVEPRPLAGLGAGLTLARGAVLCVRVAVGTLRVEPPVQRMAWQGDPVNAAFLVDVPPGTPDGDLLAQATVHADEVAVGTVVFAFRVRARAPEGASPAVLQGEMRRHRSAFASYASEDREAMLARIAGIQSWVRDFEVFIDVQALRAGDRWQARIDAELARRDRLLLFWSTHARESPWVDYEWRAAARLKGVDVIDPVPLEDPRDAPPPAELAHLHFGDPLLPLIAAERRRHAAP